MNFLYGAALVLLAMLLCAVLIMLGGLFGWIAASVLHWVFDFDWSVGKAVGVVGGALVATSFSARVD